MISLQFLITAFVVVIAPGTGVIYTLALGLGQGRRAALIAALGCTLGIVPHLAAAILGLAAVLHTSALLFQIVKFAGVAYLLWLAYQALKSGGALSVSGDAQRQPAWAIARPRCTDQYPEPETVDLLSGALAAVSVGQCRNRQRGDGDAGRDLHGNDLCSFCDLRRLCRRGARFPSGV